MSCARQVICCAVDNYSVRMNTPDISTLLRQLGWGANDLARKLRVRDVTVRRWLRGTNPVPTNLQVWLQQCVDNPGNAPDLPEGW